MRSSSLQTSCPVHRVPALRFVNQTLTSASSLILFKAFIYRLDLVRRLRHCCRHLRGVGDFKLPDVFLTLNIHIVLGYRGFDDVRNYHDDPLVLRVLGLRRLPSTATLSRSLRAVDVATVSSLKGLNSELILERLAAEHLPRLTLDFDGMQLLDEAA